MIRIAFLLFTLSIGCQPAATQREAEPIITLSISQHQEHDNLFVVCLENASLEPITIEWKANYLEKYKFFFYDDNGNPLEFHHPASNQWPLIEPGKEIVGPGEKFYAVIRKDNLFPRKVKATKIACNCEVKYDGKSYFSNMFFFTRKQISLEEDKK